MITENCKQPSYSSTLEYMNYLWCIRTECYIAMKMNKLPLHALRGNLTNITSMEYIKHICICKELLRNLH